MTLVWCDPPPSTLGRWRQLLEPVMSRPEAWALVREYDEKDQALNACRSLRQAARGERTVRVPPGRWEFRYGRVDGPRFGVWARWMGP